MTVKLMVLYPQPRDENEFEHQYVSQHLPLMRTLLGPGVPIPTYRTVGTLERPAPYYRIAEIHFRSQEHFDQFAKSDNSKIGRDSSIKVSTGGKPIFLVCQEQPEI